MLDPEEYGERCLDMLTGESVRAEIPKLYEDSQLPGGYQYFHLGMCEGTPLPSEMELEPEPEMELEPEPEMEPTASRRCC
eukprot:COSAG06_NODE_49202_length_327_cov_0.671053_1_plen_80_part_00